MQCVAGSLFVPCTTVVHTSVRPRCSAFKRAPFVSRGTVVVNPRAARCLYGRVAKAVCVDDETKTAVAIKVMEPQHAAKHVEYWGKKAVAEDVDTEISVLNAVAAAPHRNLMGMHPMWGRMVAAGTTARTVAEATADVSGKQLVTVTQWCDGGDVFGLCKRARDRGSRVPIRLARQMLTDVASGLQHMHKLGYSHMDVSPENVLVGKDGFVVMDYGCSVPTSAATAPLRNGLRRGKPTYAAPEVLANGTLRAGSQTKCDVYSLGVTLFTVLAGTQLYTSSTDARYGYVRRGQIGVLVDAWHLTSRFANGALDLVCRMLAMNPADRPTLEQVLAHPWVKGAATSKSTPL